MKKWRKIKQEFLDQMSLKLDEREAEAQFKLLFEAHTGQYGYSLTDLEQVVTKETSSTITHQIEELLQGKPIQYVFGYAWFDDLKLTVNEYVLIPRQETEELVYWILNHCSLNQTTKLLDIGAGSGAISLALAKQLPQATVLGVDISEKALTVAERNRKSLQIENCRFEKLDILSKPNLPETFDLIVSNPPYITKDFEINMEQNVTKYEPHLALFVPNNDPLLFYKAIADFSLNHLNSRGALYFEINEFFKDDVVKMLENNGFQHVEAKKDLNDNWRMVRAKIE